MSMTLDGASHHRQGAWIIAYDAIDGLDVGSDQGGLVGPYGAANAFPGAVQSVVIELAPEPAD